MKTLVSALSFIFILQLTACGGGGGSTSSATSSTPISSNSKDELQTPEAPPVQSASPEDDTSGESQESTDNDVNYTFLKGHPQPEQVISSVITGIDYPVNVYLPVGYHESSQNYPIIYALDGQVLYPGLPYLLEQEGVNAILVAISEGPDDRRRTDYLLPGATDFFHFITTELIPLVEPGLRIEPAQRSIVGTSFGGVMAGLTMLMDDVSDPYFHNFLAFDASFYQHQAETEALELERYLASNELNGRLFLSSAVPEGNDQYVTDFESSLNERAFSGLQIVKREYNTTHGAITEPSFREAVSLFFNP
ncbi:alpha/beta hydrolase [Gilvimarinus sp. 1_MG-2023]|uniref:alpha/beta hydrolase n=1 Tax=Gilvimarinus sp. 1_MG-2023 TaxID=3062638 RepID=UPI0026E31AEA|nr:alpha/beta hydrolase-fold protein [Gilvimarinus sp. 1_MG-2023]MDO6745839.1 alpha/beta hydrolase-fold protein [Gilvimarinus sp. 1_MG-2023]